MDGISWDIGPWPVRSPEGGALDNIIETDDPEAAASLAPLDGSDFHAYRRAWATARKHLPLKDVAAAGGWKSTVTIQRCYQQPDEETMLSVVLGGAELREKKA